MNIGELIPFVFLLMPVWIVWIVMHYRAKGRHGHKLDETEGRRLEELNELAERMAERIKTLETILDAETPEWRDHVREEGWPGAEESGEWSGGHGKK
jgi:phage shock protein B